MTNNKNIKILDCTLRDGGYLIDWDFGEKKIQSIINNLNLAKIDFIECGFLKEKNTNSDKSFFSSPLNLEKFIDKTKNYTLMVNYGEYEISNFEVCMNKNIKIRVAFKKYQQIDALEYISELKKLGWDVFANPMNTNSYSESELENLINKINNINPYGFSIVDTLGNMYENDVLRIFNFIENRLNSQIALGFHSHNSLQLSFSNTKALIKTNSKRTLIIDSCVYGMGRGAGNLCTELITKYLNDYCQSNYKIMPILKIINNELKPIYSKNPWGYSTPYYIAAINGCHPNYAKKLVEQGYSDEDIDKFLKKIPYDKRISFDNNFLIDIT